MLYIIPIYTMRKIEQVLVDLSSSSISWLYLSSVYLKSKYGDYFRVCIVRLRKLWYNIVRHQEWEVSLYHIPSVWLFNEERYGLSAEQKQKQDVKENLIVWFIMWLFFIALILTLILR